MDVLNEIIQFNPVEDKDYVYAFGLFRDEMTNKYVIKQIEKDGLENEIFRTDFLCSALSYLALTMAEQGMAREFVVNG